MSNKDQFLLFVIIALIGAGVVATAVSMPPSRFDPVGAKNVVGVAGALVGVLSAICAILVWTQRKSLENIRQNGPENTLRSAALFVVGPAILSGLIIYRVVSTELVLGAVFVVVGALVIWVSPELRFRGRTMGILVASAVGLTIGVTQLFQQVLGLPLP
jgi:tripartite tricarboxylate transporter TctB family protein